MIRKIKLWLVDYNINLLEKKAEGRKLTPNEISELWSMRRHKEQLTKQ